MFAWFGEAHILTSQWSQPHANAEKLIAVARSHDASGQSAIGCQTEAGLGHVQYYSTARHLDSAHKALQVANALLCRIETPAKLVEMSTRYKMINSIY